MPDTKNHLNANHIWGLTRIGLGFIFLWAFVDKMFGLGFATCRDELNTVAVGCESAVVGGGSPTEGFLSFATKGPLADFYQTLAGNPVVDFLFMAGLLGIGVALIFGIAMRIAVFSGVLMMLMMWSAVLPAENNPLIDDHIIYALVLTGLLAVNSEQKFGFGQRWGQTKLVQSMPFLK